MGFGELPQADLSGEPAAVATAAATGNVVTVVDPMAALVTEARAILAAARGRGSVDAERAIEFARRCIEQDPIARLGLGVLDGGVFIAARLVDLALAVASESSADVARLAQRRKLTTTATTRPAHAGRKENGDG